MKYVSMGLQDVAVAVGPLAVLSMAPCLLGVGPADRYSPATKSRRCSEVEAGSSMPMGGDAAWETRNPVALVGRASSSSLGGAERPGRRHSEIGSAASGAKA